MKLGAQGEEGGGGGSGEKFTDIFNRRSREDNHMSFSSTIAT